VACALDPCSFHLPGDLQTIFCSPLRLPANVSLRQHTSGAAGLAYWVEHCPASELYRPEWRFRDVVPALRLGLIAHISHPHRSFNDLFPRMEARYVQWRNGSPLDWNDALPFAQAVLD
jgi:hypothetical protein